MVLAELVEAVPGVPLVSDELFEWYLALKYRLEVGQAVQVYTWGRS